MTEKDETPQTLDITQWGKDPMFSCFCKMYVADIIQLQEIQNAPPRTLPLLPQPKTPQHYPGPYPPVFEYQGHPVWKVDIVGIIVGVLCKERFINYKLDDGTGVITCTYWRKQKENSDASNLSASLQSLKKDVDKESLASNH